MTRIETISHQPCAEGRLPSKLRPMSKGRQKCLQDEILGRLAARHTIARETQERIAVAVNPVDGIAQLGRHFLRR